MSVVTLTDVSGEAHARHYIETLGLALVHIPYGRKGPHTPGWQDHPTRDPAAFRGRCNMGVVHCASGTCSLDLDDLDSARKVLAAEGVDVDELLATHNHVVGRGRRILFRLPAGAEDLRKTALARYGQTLLEFRAGRHQDVLPPSMHPSGKPYAWSGGEPPGALRPMPEQLVRYWRRLLIAPRPNGGTGGTGEVSVTPEQLQELTDALRFWRPDDRDEWVLAAAALRSCGAYDVWDAWSRLSAKYDHQDALRVWASLTPDGGADYRKIFAVATERGWPNPKKRYDGDEGALPSPTPPAAQETPRFPATPYVWRDPATIPPRQWLYGRHYVRGLVAITAAVSGAGKSSISIAEAVAMASGQPLLGIEPACGPHRVWICNLEDPRDEIERRIAACAIHYRLAPESFVDHLRVDSGLERPLVIADQTSNGIRVHEALVDALIEEVRASQIDVLIVDPFVSCHAVNENDNMALDLVAKTWARIAKDGNCAVELVHHVRKTGGAAVTVEDVRGASAIVAAARTARVLNRMTIEEAEKAGVEEHWRYVRIDTGKANLAPLDKTQWARMETVALGNGDEVGVATPWQWPDAFRGVVASDIDRVLTRMGDGRWRAHPQSPEWVGHVIGEVLEIDSEGAEGRTQLRSIITKWLGSGVLERVELPDEHRKMRAYIRAGTAPELDP